MIRYINKAHDIDHERERERLITKLLVQTLNPEGGLLPPNVVAAGDDSPFRQGAGTGLDLFLMAT